MIEHERSFVFTHEGIRKFSKEIGALDNIAPSAKSTRIDDYYMGKGKRIRHSYNQAGGERKYILTRKTGNKADGYRFEQEIDLSEEAANVLKEDAILAIHKTRFELLPHSSYDITVDIVDSPLKLAILEIEAKEEAAYPVPIDVTKKLWGKELRECPLCSFSLFRRKIGICGGPSSGKTETAKHLSHVLNTEFGANSFHVTEFATSFIQKYDRNPQFNDQFFLWHGQKEREDNAEKADIVISDCPTFLTYIYGIHLDRPEFNEKSAFVFSKIYKRALFDVSNYTDIILLKMQDYVENNVRYQSKEEAKEIESKITNFLEHHRIPHMTGSYQDHEKILKDLFYIN